ncbi:MAG: sterol desaturase family protein [Desulfuromusa sp.]|nr:sterol desaturase family protein [Desulfuromusa sp.]
MAHEGIIRSLFFFVIFALVAYGEIVASRRQLTVSKTERWFNNLSMILLSNILIKLTLPVAATGVAVAAAAKNWGLFNSLPLPYWMVILISILILDLVVYLQHLMFHAVPILWRIHMVHHADLDLDVTSALRIHPLELIISMGIKIMVVAALGIPVLAVLIFEIILNAAAMFNHGNLRLSDKFDRRLRLLTVTPDMHRVHHSVMIRETNSNFGFNFPYWDRLFGTYRAQPVDGHEQMTIGLSPFRNVEQITFLKLLIFPFIEEAGHYSLKYIGRDPKTTTRRKR